MSGIQKIKLPYYFHGGFERQRLVLRNSSAADSCRCKIVGWHSRNRMRVNLQGGNSLTLSKKNTRRLLLELGLVPESVPGYNRCDERRGVVVRIEHMTYGEWEVWDRVRQEWQNLEEMADEMLSNWGDHLRYLRDEYSHYDEDIDGLTDPIRKLPRILRYMKTGFFPPLDVDDDDLGYYDEGIGCSGLRPRGRTVVEVRIEEISDGKL